MVVMDMIEPTKRIRIRDRVIEWTPRVIAMRRADHEASWYDR